MKLAESKNRHGGREGGKKEKDRPGSPPATDALMEKQPAALWKLLQKHEPVPTSADMSGENVPQSLAWRPT